MDDSAPNDPNAQVALLRTQGLTPKEIARRLGLRPAQVTALIQQHAKATLPEANAPGRVVACQVSAGWSDGLIIEGVQPGDAWLDVADPAPGTRGLVTVLVARENRYGNLQATVFIVDVFCLGVKDLRGRTMAPDQLREFVHGAFHTYSDPPIDAPLELAQALIFGAIDFARSIGFEPHADFARAAPLLGAPSGPTRIKFGDRGRPKFVNGPHDDVQKVLATLRRTVGEGKFDFIHLSG